MPDKITLTLNFPLYTIAGKEENPDDIALFDDILPQKGLRKSISGKPPWVRKLPVVKTVWSPAAIDGAIPLFDSEETARVVIGADQLVVKFGDLDIIQLHSKDDILGWVNKANGVDKIRFYVTSIPSGSTEKRIGTTEIPAKEIENV